MEYLAKVVLAPKQCGICMMDFDEEEMVRLNSCDHSFCLECAS